MRTTARKRQIAETVRRPVGPRQLQMLKDRIGEITFERAGEGRVLAIVPEWADVYWEIVFKHEDGRWNVGRIRYSSGPRDFETYVKSEQDAEGEVLKAIFERELLPLAAKWAAEHQADVFADDTIGEESNPEAWGFESEEKVEQLLDWADDYVSLAKEYIGGVPGTAGAIKKRHAVDRELRRAARAVWDCRAELHKLVANVAPPEPSRRKAT